MEIEEAIAHAKKDPEAFGRLYDMYYQPVFGFILSRTRHGEVAKDLTSETFFQALKNIQRFKPKEPHSFKSWLFAIAIAQIGNYFRARRRFLQVTTEECPELIAGEDFEADYALNEAEKEQETKEQAVRLCRFLGQLNDKQQNVIHLRYFSHLTIGEIAATLHMKESTVKSHLHRATKKLSALMTANDQPNGYAPRESAQSRTALGASRV